MRTVVHYVREGEGMPFPCGAGGRREYAGAPGERRPCGVSVAAPGSGLVALRRARARAGMPGGDLAVAGQGTGMRWARMSQFVQGIKDGSAIGIGYLSVSFTFGLAAVSAGLSWWQAALVSAANLTSAGQFAGVTVMAAAGSYLEMAVSQFVINLRYALMGISLSQKVDGDFRTPQKLVLGFGITDEVFAVAMSREGEVSSRYFAGLILLPYLGWTLGTLAGAVCGDVLPREVSDALGSAIYGMFLAIIIPAARQDKKIFMVTLAAIALSCAMRFLPAFRGVSEGFSIILCASVASAIGAVFFPMEDDNERSDAPARDAKGSGALVGDAEGSDAPAGDARGGIAPEDRATEAGAPDKDGAGGGAPGEKVAREDP